MEGTHPKDKEEKKNNTFKSSYLTQKVHQNEREFLFEK